MINQGKCQSESAILANAREIHLGRAAYIFWDDMPENLSRLQTTQNGIEKYFNKLCQDYVITLAYPNQLISQVV